MSTRRNFIQSMIALAGSNLAISNLIGSIQRAEAIEPEADSSFLDAEHIVVLMQENRSFDHAFGSMRGVRGFNDPRAIKLEDANPVWVQTNKAGKSYLPFRLDMKETKATWMGCLPHSWTDQVDAANGGKHDRWLDAKAVKGPYEGMPLAFGYHTRDDLPFYYALADAFTVCDHNFCSTLTGTTPNRLHLWTGTTRRAQDVAAQAIVRNEDCTYTNIADWKTFPERLEEHGISWKIYQNELSVPSGLKDETDAWLSNFTDNPLEWFKQYEVFSHEAHRRFTNHIDDVAKRDNNPLHERAFCTNRKDPNYRQLEELEYEHDGTPKRMLIPKGDTLYQFRTDVANGELPKVSWLVPPERFSDHPCSAWYGQWYLSEVINILTANPEVWRKTIFVLTYDENDGFFDHVPPFQAPCNGTGKSSAGLDCSLDYLDAEQDRQFKPKAALRSNSIGLGFRVPMIIASPWSRGGAVCSQVFDHTSVIQLMEKVFSHQLRNQIRETNISPWRRAICGDLSSAFRNAVDTTSSQTNIASMGELADALKFIKRDAYLADIHRSQFRNVPESFTPLTDDQITAIRIGKKHPAMPAQEQGTRPACPVPYELACDGSLSSDRTAFTIVMEAKKNRFGDRSTGAPFIAYIDTLSGMIVKHFAVEAGGSVEDSFGLELFPDGVYSVRVHGPNGFYRYWTGDKNDPSLEMKVEEVCDPGKSSTCKLGFRLRSDPNSDLIAVQVHDNAYGNPSQEISLSSQQAVRSEIDLKASHQWYDLTITAPSYPRYKRIYAGHVENGTWTTSDPQMA
ncbi:MAG: phosphocholine-specific phospholipase C [Pirellula sp.]|jgi:phospholipase C